MDLLGFANRATRKVLVARGVESHTRRIGSHDIHYYRREGRGSGGTAVLVHGLGSSANSFARTLVPLSARFGQIFALDIPGNGFSPLPSSGPLALREQMTSVVNFIDELVGGPVFLVGNSLGGAMSLFLASERPDLVRALALISPAGAKVEPHRLEALMNTFDVRTNRQARAITRRLFHKPPLPLLLLSKEMRRIYETPTVRSVMGEVKPSDSVTEALLQGLKMPTMVIWGRSEKLLPYEGIDYFRAHLPASAQVHEVPGFGHIPQMERPAEVVQRLIRFADDAHL